MISIAVGARSRVTALSFSGMMTVYNAGFDRCTPVRCFEKVWRYVIIDLDMTCAYRKRKQLSDIHHKDVIAGDLHENQTVTAS